MSTPCQTSFVSKSISVQEFGIPIKESYVNTFLEVRATIRIQATKPRQMLELSLRNGGNGGMNT